MAARAAPIGIAQTLVHTPQIMVVDEPTAGLDPVERLRFRNLLAQVGDDVETGLYLVEVVLACGVPA